MLDQPTSQQCVDLPHRGYIGPLLLDLLDQHSSRLFKFFVKLLVAGYPG